MYKGWQGYGKKWMHFVYKLDNLLRTIPILDENSYVTTTFHFLNVFQLQTYCAFNMHYYKSHPKIPTLSNLICYFSWFFCFAQNDPKIEKHYKWTLKRLKLGMISSFHPHRMCTKVERVTTKTWCTSSTNWTSSFEVWGFRTKTHLLQRNFIF